VLARIAVRRRAAENPAMRGFRIAAWCVAATTVGLLVVGTLRLLDVIHGDEEIKPI
jgi:hypothetical protein